MHRTRKLPCIFSALLVCYSSRSRLRDSLLRPCYDFLLFFTTQTRPVHRETDSGDEKFIMLINKIHNPILGYWINPYPINPPLASFHSIGFLPFGIGTSCTTVPPKLELVKELGATLHNIRMASYDHPWQSVNLNKRNSNTLLPPWFYLNSK